MCFSRVWWAASSNKLESYDDTSLHKDLENNPEEMLKLVNTYFHLWLKILLWFHRGCRGTPFYTLLSSLELSIVFFLNIRNSKRDHKLKRKYSREKYNSKKNRIKNYLFTNETTFANIKTKWCYKFILKLYVFEFNLDCEHKRLSWIFCWLDKDIYLWFSLF